MSTSAYTLPAYLTDQTEDTIMNNMLATLPANLDASEGSYIWDALSPAAMQLAQAALWAQGVLQYGFAQTTYGTYLDYRVAEKGVSPRKAAVAASGTVTFTGTSGTTIPAGTNVSTQSDQNTQAVVFTTNAVATVGSGGTVDVAVTATQAGASGNVPAGFITVLSGGSIAGISSISNAAATTGGADQESDAALLTRYLSQVQNPGTSGNKADYKNWAMSVSGVGGASVIPLWNGNGTVKVAVIDENYSPANSTLVTSVQNYIDPTGGQGDGMAPIGANVTVVAATGVTVTISATVTVDASGRAKSDIQTDYTAALTTYLHSLCFAADPTVRINQVGSLLLGVAGVEDYSGLTINGGTANVSINTDQVPQLGTVTIS